MQFIKVTLAARPDYHLIIPKNKVMKVNGSIIFGSNCCVSYEIGGNLVFVDVLENIEEVYRMLNA